MSYLRGFELGVTEKQIDVRSGQSGTRARNDWIASPSR